MVIRVLNEHFSSNTYLVKDSQKINQCLIIDPGISIELIENEIQNYKLRPIAIIATHGHYDHIGGASYFKQKYGIPFYLHKSDYKLMKSANFFLKLSKINKTIKIEVPDFLLDGFSNSISIANFNVNVLNFPGHTEGSCVIDYENNLFTGDTLFKSGLYINSLPGEDIGKLKVSIGNLFEKFSLNKICYPGHGKEATIDFIKTYNIELLYFLKTNYIAHRK